MASMYECITTLLSVSKGERELISYQKINEEIKRSYPDNELPLTAYKRPQWWGNESSKKSKSRQCRAWMDAGWHVDMSQSKLGEYIVFVKQPS